MKETVNANIGSMAFTIDRDAYQALERYFAEIRRRLPADDSETMDDLERRLAEILCEKVPSPMHVVTLEIARTAMNRLGAPDASAQPEAALPPVRKLYRSRTNRSIAGICGGLGDYFDADPTMIRLAMLLLILLGGLSFWVYIILWIVIPEEPARAFSVGRNEKKR